MAQNITETNSRLRGWLIAFFIIIVIVLIVLFIWAWMSPEPVVEQPKPTPCVCDEVKPEAPAELPKTGYDGE